MNKQEQEGFYETDAMLSWIIPKDIAKLIFNKNYFLYESASNQYHPKNRSTCVNLIERRKAEVLNFFVTSFDITKNPDGLTARFSAALISVIKYFARI